MISIFLGPCKCTCSHSLYEDILYTYNVATRFDMTHGNQQVPKTFAVHLKERCIRCLYFLILLLRPRSRRESSEGKKRGGGFTKLCSLSPQLQKLVGVPTLARTEVVKQIWAYIREKKLQDPTNKKTIICDTMLLSLFEVESIDMFQMNKALTKHIWPLNSDGAAPAKSTDKEKQQHKKEKQEDLEEPKRKEKKQKVGGGGGKSGFLAPLQLSDALVKFLGTGESEMPRSDVIKRMWNYIKGNNLQDPTDKRRIICDEKLKELFNVDSFVGFTVSKLLVDHFIKA